jgi:hypothetical protein
MGTYQLILFIRSPVQKAADYHGYRFRGPGKGCELFLQSIGEPLVVIVQERYPFRLRCLAAEVPGLTPAHVFRELDHSQPRVCDFTQGVDGFHIGTINDDNAFDVANGLR